MTLLITVLVLGMLGSLSPSTIVVFILLLATTRARVNAAAFLIGWSTSLIVVFTFSYLAGGTHSLHEGSGHTAVEIVEVVLGLGLVGVGARQWRLRGRPRASTNGFFTAHLKDLSPIEATVVGVLEQPWTLTAAAAVIVVRHHTALIVTVLAFVLFTLASTATVGLTYLYYARRPGEAEAHLSDLRARLVAAGPALFAAVSVVVGVYLVVDGVAGLLGS
jgi:Sap, sulfolipid-1-addressing protein